MQSSISAISYAARLGDFRWLRAHISVLAIGSVMLISVNLLFGGHTLWSVRAVGVWLLLLVVHTLVLIITRLYYQLIDVDPPGASLPVRDAMVVDSTLWQRARTGDEVASTHLDEQALRNWQSASDASHGVSPGNSKEAP